MSTSKFKLQQMDKWMDRGTDGVTWSLLKLQITAQKQDSYVSSLKFLNAA